MEEHNADTWIVATHLAYLAISVVLTVWVARTLHKHGRIFLVEAFGGNDGLADSVNHLLVVGFYLVNFGFVSRSVTAANRGGGTVVESIEALKAFLPFVAAPTPGARAQSLRDH